MQKRNHNQFTVRRSGKKTSLLGSTYYLGCGFRSIWFNLYGTFKNSLLWQTNFPKWVTYSINIKSSPHVSNTNSDLKCLILLLHWLVLVVPDKPKYKCITTYSEII